MREDGGRLSSVLESDKEKGGGKGEKSNSTRSLKGPIANDIPPRLILKKQVEVGRASGAYTHHHVIMAGSARGRKPWHFIRQPIFAQKIMNILPCDSYYSKATSFPFQIP